MAAIWKSAFVLPWTGLGRFILKCSKQNMQLPSVRYRERLHFQLSQTYSLNQKEYVP